MEKKKKSARIIPFLLIVFGIGLAVFSITGIMLGKGAKAVRESNNTITIHYGATASLYAITDKNPIYPNGTARVESKGALPVKLVKKSYAVFSLRLNAPIQLDVKNINYTVTKLLNIGPFSVKLDETRGAAAPGSRIVVELDLARAVNESYKLLREIGLPVTTDISLEVRMNAETRIAGKKITMNPVIVVGMGYNDPLYRVTVTSIDGTEIVAMKPSTKTLSEAQQHGAWRKILPIMLSIGVAASLAGAVLYARTRSYSSDDIIASLSVPVIEVEQAPSNSIEAKSLEEVANLAERNAQPLLVARGLNKACTLLGPMYICARLHEEASREGSGRRPDNI